MTIIRLTVAVLALFCAAQASAADLGAATGHYAKDGVRIDVSHAVALSQDNTEGLLDHGPQVRVLLSDRDIPVEALYGIAFPPVTVMARAGAVRGLLLEFDPADRTSLRITVLDKPDDPTAFNPSLSLMDSNGLWRSLTAQAASIAGDYQASDGSDLAFSFDAPLSTDPVVADLKGAAAQSSEQVRVLIARAQALARGDLPAALALTTRQAGADLKTMSPADLEPLSASMTELIPQLKAIKRVVVRKHTAVGIMGEGGWSNLVFEDGGWKVAD